MFTEEEQILFCSEGGDLSTYILMKILESAPRRYDKGIRILTFGRLGKVYGRLMSHIEKGDRVIDLGCGTGELTLRAAQKGATVKGIDVNSQMLEIAQIRARDMHLTQNVQLCEMGVAELGAEQSEAYDAVMSGLCFSQLTEDELTYAVGEAARILKPGGLLLVADLVTPKSIAKRMLDWVIRLPLTIVAYLFTQATPSRLKDLPGKIEEAGFLVNSVRSSRIEGLIELVARKPEGVIK
jgi:ubiquinone/menaquinone biosynthesis C-methylase UbiE